MKTIALMPIKNESWILETSLRNISEWADIIVVADQNSTDGSKEICAKFSKVTVIDNKEEGHSNRVRWQLLDYARKCEGNNLIVCIDADEAVVPMNFFANKEFFSTFSAGDSFELSWIQLWKSPSYYRTDHEWKKLTKHMAFIDDRIIEYDKSFVINDHTSRIPVVSRKPFFIKQAALLHLEYVPFLKSQLKQAWYRCSELIQAKKSARRINATYRITLDNPHIKSEELPEEWKNIHMPAQILSATSPWHKEQIFLWFDQYGIEFFEPLQLWHIDELKNEFIKRTGRVPHSKTFPSWLLQINAVKNSLKNIFR